MFNPRPFLFKPIAAGIDDRALVFQRLRYPGTHPSCDRIPDSCTPHGWTPAEVCQTPSPPDTQVLEKKGDHS